MAPDLYLKVIKIFNCFFFSHTHFSIVQSIHFLLKVIKNAIQNKQEKKQVWKGSQKKPWISLKMQGPENMEKEESGGIKQIINCYWLTVPGTIYSIFKILSLILTMALQGRLLLVPFWKWGKWAQKINYSLKIIEYLFSG